MKGMGREEEQRITEDSHKLFGRTDLSESWVKGALDESIKISPEFCNCVFATFSSFHRKRVLSFSGKKEKEIRSFMTT